MILTKLIEIARDVPKFARVRIVAACVHKGEIVSYGFNHEKTHPFQAKYGRNRHSIFWHAETHAIFNAKRDSKRFTDLYVARVVHDTHNNELTGNCKPCKGCMRCIKDYVSGNVFYTLHSNKKGVITYESFSV